MNTVRINLIKFIIWQIFIEYPLSIRHWTSSWDTAIRKRDTVPPLRAHTLLGKMENELLNSKYTILKAMRKSYDQPRYHIKKQSHYFTNKGSSSQSYGFSSSHVWIWELDYRENWVLKNLCFWTVVLEKTLENLLDCKNIKPVNPKGNKSWIFIGRTDW